MGILFLYNIHYFFLQFDQTCVSLKLFFVCVLFTLLALVTSGLFKNLLTTGVWMMLLWLIIMLIGGVAKINSTTHVLTGNMIGGAVQKNVLTKLTTLGLLLNLNLGLFKNLLTTGVWMMLLYLIIILINGIVMNNSTTHVLTGNMMVGGVQKNVLMKLTMIN